MADQVGEQDIRGIHIETAVRGYEDEARIFRNYVTVKKTKAREVIWFQKTSGYLDTPTTTGMTNSLISIGVERSRPAIAGPSWTKNTSYVKKFMVESETISDEDIRDSEVQVLITTIRDLGIACEAKVDAHIWDIVTEGLSPSNINTAAATGTGWDDTTNGNPILDLLTGQQQIRSYGYDPRGSVVLMNSIEHKNLMNWLITVKGQYVPSFASELAKRGWAGELVGSNLIVSENATTDYAMMLCPGVTATYMEFTQMTGVKITDPGIGTKVRIWAEGICYLNDPKSGHLITDTVT